jgi:glycosyltransferase involved in cell wall biosynthesis
VKKIFPNKPVILHAVNKLVNAGAEKQLYYIIRELRHKYQFIIAILSHQKDIDTKWYELAIPIFSEPKIKSGLVRNISFLSQQVGMSRPAIVHSWLFHPNLIAAFVKIFKEYILITSKRGSNFWYQRRHFIVNKFVYKTSNLIMTNSKSLGDEISAYTNDVKEKIRIIPNGIDLDEIQNRIVHTNIVSRLKEQGFHIVGSVGRFVEEKRLDDIIKAAHNLSREHHNLRFVIVGGGGKFEYYRELINSQGLDDYIFLTGEVDKASTFTCGFDIFLMASSSEGMSNALMEAMALKKPIIATNVGEIPSLIENHVSGILIPPCQPDQIVKGINFYIENELIAKAYGKRAYDTIQNYSLKRMTSKVDAMYSEALQL